MRVRLFLLFSLFAAGTLRASPPCDTIVLNNGKKIPARDIVVTATEVRYQQCADTRQVEFSFPIGFVYGVISGREFRPVSPDGQAGFEAAAHHIQGGDGTSLVRKWVFRRRVDGAERHLAEGQRIQVRIIDKNGLYQKHVGRMYDIRNDSLFLADNQQIAYGLAMVDITKIKMLNPNGRPYGSFAKFAFWLFAVLGVIFIFISLFSLAGFGLLGQLFLRAASPRILLLAVIGLVPAATFGVWHLIVASPKMIPRPATEWTWEIDSLPPADNREQPMP